MKRDQLDLLALLPCPVKLTLEQKLHQLIHKINEYYDTELQYKIVSNAVAQADIFQEIELCKSMDDLPNIMIAPGFSRFFYKDFVDRFRKRGFFESVCCETVSNVYQRLGISDPDSYYDLIAFNPLVFLVDKTRDQDYPTPRNWSDIVNNGYKNMIAYRGHTDREFCEGILLNIYKEFGREGIRRLGETVKCRLHPAQMVKYAGSKKEEAPAISILPYSFACMVKQNPKVEIVWPEDGAIVNPLVMLVKKGCSQAVKELAGAIAGGEIANIFMEGGFYSIHKAEGEKEEEARPYQWLGWDFIKNNKLHELLKELNQTMYEVIHQEDGGKYEDYGKGGCTCS